MTAVNKNTIYSDTFSVMYSNISGILAGSLNGLYAFFPDVGGTDFPGYPICTINSADVGVDRLTMGDAYTSQQSINVGVSIHSKSMQTLDQLSDRLVSGLIASDKSTTGTYASGLKSFNIESSATSTQVLGDDRVHSKSFGVSYLAY